MNEIYQITDTSSNGKYSPFIQKIINYVDDHISEEKHDIEGYFGKYTLYERELCQSYFRKRSSGRLFQAM